MQGEHVTEAFMRVARGERPADLVLHNARVVNVFTRDVEQASVSIAKGFVVHVGDASEAHETIDLQGAYLAPGLIDAHMHVESTMLLPREFARLALPHGTTGVILDPHEIANVLGIEGIRFLMDDAQGLPMNIRFAASSCVPSCGLENSGALLDASDLEPLFESEDVVALAEMMNFPGVIHGDPGVLEKVRLGLTKRLVDGHCPGLRGRPLQAYIAAGISSDHECTTLEEAREKFQRGMRIYIRQGSAARNLEALLPLVTEANAHRFSFCTDDRHPADLRDEGHIDNIVRIAIQGGLKPETAIAIGSQHTAQHYGLRHLGAIAPGYQADLFSFEDLQCPVPDMVFHHGKQVAAGGIASFPRSAREGTPPDAPVRIPAGFDASKLRIPSSGSGKVRVIGMDPHQLVTTHLVVEGCVQDGSFVSDVTRDILKMAVIERHKGTGNIGLGFVQGFKLQRGAIASTVGHDAHNLAVVGTNDGDMALAAHVLAGETPWGDGKRLHGGGQCAVADGEVLAVLPLPVAGLMSDEPAETVIAQQAELLRACEALGCPHHDPFMPLSFMPLPVIPSLKLSDLGVVDVDAFKIVPVEV